MTELLTRMLSYWLKFIGYVALLSSTILIAQADNMYIYKDASGQVLLTNVNPSGNFDKFTKKVKVTYYPSSEPEATNNSNNVSSMGAPSKYSGYATPSRNANRNSYDLHIKASAKRHGVDPALMKAMMHTESAFNPNARSPVGAQGLMQLMPATARRFKVRNAWNPSENIEGAAKYIAWLTKRFKGNVEFVVAGYNAGEGNVDKYGGIPPFRETQGYVKKVLGRYNSLYSGQNGLFNTSSVQSLTDPNITIQQASLSSGTTTFGTNTNYSNSAIDALRR